MQGFDNGRLTIAVNKRGNMVTMDWIGRSDVSDPGREMTPYFDQVIEEMTGSELTMTFGQLTYINSSSVRLLTQLFKKLDTAGIQTVVIYDANSESQTMLFTPLKTFTRRMPHLSIKGE